MELSIYDIIKGIVSTPKSILLRKKLGKVTFWVTRLANKSMIHRAVERIWNVKVDNVRIINLHGKTKTVGRKVFAMADKKKAIVTLKKGYKIDLPEQFETMGISDAEEKAPKGKE
jgi:large subunit ribosomal protein L23